MNMENATSNTVLIVEDDHEVRKFVHDILSGAGYRVAEAESAAAAEELAAVQSPSAILLDLGLPDRDGMQLLRRFCDPVASRGSTTPTIVLSSRDGETDKVSALDAGADDYLTKPFSTTELLARIRVALRHARSKPVDDEPIAVGPIHIDQGRHRVTVDGSAIHLTPIEFRLLVQLARGAGKVITHRQLLEAVWGASKVHHIHYLRVHMQALRRKIEREPSRPRWLETEPGIGYRLRDA
jgi:two-component system, OmpR family, KDP operon response regulator KdpE